MTIPLLFFFISILIWFFPPFKQYKSEYFIFFLILAFADPVNALLNIFLAIKTIQVNLVITFLLILSLLDRNRLKKNWIVFTILFIVLLTALANFPIKAVYGIKIFLSCIILFIILKDTILYLNKNRTINLFFLIFILYEITIIIKYIYTTSRTPTGVIYFYTTSFFEFFIGLYFCFFNKENSPKFKLIKEQV
jgi:hypothetical protein